MFVYVALMALVAISHAMTVAKMETFPNEKNNVTCSDKYTCPDKNTCCKLEEGGYGCCPLPEAVCCPNTTYCCPRGYKCDVAATRCIKGDHILTWFTKGPAKPAPVVNDVTCPDQSTCPDNTTCCEAPQGGYGCCPLPKATCCSDKLHCCPEGYKCDVAAGLCLKGDDILTWFTKHPAKRPAKSTPLV
ncbi:granulin-like protein [Plakobranchus ocellatus]|uniref:Granulin-like protein n=1 Tax=Plakobranchus ocellatus TaxID=259542 RepID=A0AAV3Z701_9GAST|nr:granulin-like protein [Plakobranchus ocellatus]